MEFTTFNITLIAASILFLSLFLFKNSKYKKLKRASSSNRKELLEEKLELVRDIEKLEATYKKLYPVLQEEEIKNLKTPVTLIGINLGHEYIDISIRDGDGELKTFKDYNMDGRRGAYFTGLLRAARPNARGESKPSGTVIMT